MGKKLTIEISDDVYRDLEKKSKELDTNLERLVSYALEIVRHRRIEPQSSVSKDYFKKAKMLR